jgi:hypothetical protein
MAGLYVGLFLVAAASLGLEITLTRVFSLAQWYHFAFMAISLALLGLGAGGTALSLWPSLRRRPRRTAALAAAACALCTVGGYLLANDLPFDAYRIAWDRRQFLYLAAYYLALVLPFFWASLGTGVLLATTPQRSHRVYAANLLGSAAGCALAPLALSLAGGAGAVAIWAALAALASLAFQWGRPRRPAALAGGLIAVLGCATLALARPAWFEVQLSPYKTLPQTLQAPGATLVSQRWNAQARVDVVESPALHAAPGMSLSCHADEPVQQAVFVDADNPSPILTADAVALRPWADCLPLALPFRLRPGARALVLEPGGNLDPLVAQSIGAARVTVVEPNRLLVRASAGYPGAEVAVESGRTFLRHTSERFDVIDLALSGSRNVVSTGAYSLSEEYQYTLQAFADALGRLDEGGLLVVSRWLQTPPSEELRAWSLAVTALEQSGASDVRAQLIAVRSWSTVLILVKNGPFAPEELAEVRAFCMARQFDLVYLPDLRAEEENRYNVYPGEPYATAFRELLDTPDRRAFYAAREYDVRPPTDDRPFFLHFFRWRQVPTILSELGHTWKPFGGSGYLVLLALLAVAIVAGGMLALLPAVLGTGRRTRGRARVLAYFGLLGVGYLAIEVPLLQRFILFLGHPTTAFAAVAGSLLLFSGLGSLVARRVPPRGTLVALVVAIGLTAAGLEPLFGALLGAPLVVRLLATGLALAPLGLLLGMPFPLGLARLEQEAPELVPWAWAVNGSTSVVAAVGVALGALGGGFSAVLVTAGVAYAAAALLSPGRPRPASAAR